MSDPKKCAHTLCSCTVTGDAKYCSKSCETNTGDGIGTIACDCAHSGCAGHL